MTTPSILGRLRNQLDDNQTSAQALAINTWEAIVNDGGLDGTAFGLPSVRAQAEYAAQRIEQQSARDLTGIPFAVAPEVCVRGGPTPAGYDATIVRKLFGYGAVLAVQSSTLAPLLQRGHIPIAFDPHALQSAKNLKLYAIRPSFGVVSRHGVVGAPSLTQVGVLARYPRDCAIGMDAISDFDPYDPAMTRPNCYNYAERIGQPVRALRIARQQDAPVDGVALRIERTIALDCLAWAEDLHDGVVLAETQAMGGDETAPLSLAQYEKIRVARGALCDAFATALRGIDILLMPHNPASVAAVELACLPAVSTPGELLIVANRYQETVALQVAHALQMEELS